MRTQSVYQLGFRLVLRRPLVGVYLECSLEVLGCLSEQSMKDDARFSVAVQCEAALKQIPSDAITYFNNGTIYLDFNSFPLYIRHSPIFCYRVCTRVGTRRLYLSRGVCTVLTDSNLSAKTR
jgi:hypothetical protein